MEPETLCNINGRRETANSATIARGAEVAQDRVAAPYQQVDKTTTKNAPYNCAHLHVW